MNLIKDKVIESVKSVLPIALIVFGLSITIVPTNTEHMLLFLIGVAFLVLGMSLFTAGAEMAMQPLGSKVGHTIAHKGWVWLIALVSFVIGILVTISEPDLLILADQAGNENLVYVVSVGVGIFLMIAVLRIVFGVSLTLLMILFYLAAFVMAFFVNPSFLPLAFDSGGVTTGPMTVPFIMSIGAGVSAAKISADNRDDSFGITGLCSIGPIIAVLAMGIISNSQGGNTPTEIPNIADTRESAVHYAHSLSEHGLDVLKALIPIILFAALFQLISRAFNKVQIIRMAIGIVYVIVGLTIFLTGANVGFVPMGVAIGQKLSEVFFGIPLIPISMLMGYFIVKAEPSVYVLNRLVENMSAGAISGKTTGFGLSVGVCAALGLAAVRVLTGINILWFLIPGYVIALVLSFFVPKIFVGISFDSGGVASGIMMSAFVLPLCKGACESLSYADPLTDAFGCVALVAMAPIIAIQICGLVYRLKTEDRARKFVSASESFIDYGYREPETEKVYAVKKTKTKERDVK